MSSADLNGEEGVGGAQPMLDLPDDVITALSLAFPSSVVQHAHRITKGVDQHVALLHSTTTTTTADHTANANAIVLPPRCILRQPKGLSKGSQPFHLPPLLQPSLQAELLGCLHRRLPPRTAAFFPRPLFCSASPPFLVETVIPGVDLSDALPLPASSQRPLYSAIGRAFRDLHSIPCSLYGPIQRIHADVPQGSAPSWAAVMSPFLQRLDTGGVEPATCAALRALYRAQLPYLMAFDAPVLVHSDVNAANIRVDGASAVPRLTGLVDLGDVQAGDGLYDAGRVLSHWQGNWQVVEWLEEGYFEDDPARGRWSSEERARICLYAASFSLWMLDAATGLADAAQTRDKYRRILARLVQPPHGSEAAR